MGDSVSSEQDVTESETETDVSRPHSPVIRSLQVAGNLDNVNGDIISPASSIASGTPGQQQDEIDKPKPRTSAHPCSDLSDLEQEVANSIGKGLRVELNNRKLPGAPEDNRNSSRIITQDISSRRQLSPDTQIPSPSLLGFPRYSTSDDFERLRLIGSGSFAKIYSCKDVRDNQLYAMKVIERSNVCTSKAIEHMNAEVAIIKNANHPFIIKYHADFVTDSAIVLVTSLAAGGDLFNHLYGYQQATTDGVLHVSPFSLTQIRLWVLELALALQALHNWGAVYRDLKPENVLIMADGHLALTDFGMCKIFNRNRLLLASDITPINESYNTDKFGDDVYGYIAEQNGHIQDKSLRTLQLPNSSYTPVYKKNKSFTSIVNNMNRFLETRTSSKHDFGANNVFDESSDVVKELLSAKLSPSSDGGTLNAKTLCGTLCYMAPELVFGMRPTPSGQGGDCGKQLPLGHGRGVDWWALGVLTYELIMGYNPFKFDGKHSVATQILNEDVVLPQKRYTVRRGTQGGSMGYIAFPTTRNMTIVEEGIPKAFQDFVNSLLVRDRHKRLGSLGKSSEVIRHPLFDGLDIGKVLKKEYSSQYQPSRSQNIGIRQRMGKQLMQKLPEIPISYNVIGVVCDDGEAVGISAAGTTDTCLTLDDSAYSHNHETKLKGNVYPGPMFSDTLQNTIGNTSDCNMMTTDQHSNRFALAPTVNMQGHGVGSGMSNGYRHFPAPHSAENEVVDIVTNSNSYSSYNGSSDDGSDAPRDLVGDTLPYHRRDHHHNYEGFANDCDIIDDDEGAEEGCSRFGCGVKTSRRRHEGKQMGEYNTNNSKWSCGIDSLGCSTVREPHKQQRYFANEGNRTNERHEEKDCQGANYDGDNTNDGNLIIDDDYEIEEDFEECEEEVVTQNCVEEEEEEEIEEYVEVEEEEEEDVEEEYSYEFDEGNTSPDGFDRVHDNLKVVGVGVGVIKDDQARFSHFHTSGGAGRGDNSQECNTSISCEWSTSTSY